MVRSLRKVVGSKYSNLVLTTSLTLLMLSILMSIYTYSSSDTSSSEYIITKALGVYLTPPWSTIDEGIKECIIVLLMRLRGMAKLS